MSIVFAVLDNPGASAFANPKILVRPDCDPNAPDPDDDVCKPGCGVAVFKGMQGLSPGNFKQTIAHELAHCFQQDTFPDQNQAPYACMKWRDEGLAEYLSNVVYPYNNHEWVWRGNLAVWELNSTVVDRIYTNCFFFQHLGNEIGDSGIVQLVKTLPTSGETDAPPGATKEGACTSASVDEQATALANYGDMDRIYHDYAKALTDGKLMDTSGVPIEYPIGEYNGPTLEIAEPQGYVRDMAPFGVHRYRIRVAAGKEADVTFQEVGDIRRSKRPSNDMDWDDVPMSMKLQGDQCDPGVFLVVTTTKPGSRFELGFPEVRDLPGGMQSGEAVCDIGGTWVVDNDSLDISPMAFTLDYIRGEVRITFREDGKAELAYSNFEYRIFDDDEIVMLGMTVLRHEEFIYTTNAHGETTYEVDGDEIAFGALFESDYLDGTQTIHHIRTSGGAFGEDIDEILMRDPEGLYLFSGYVNFDLESDGSVLQLRFGDRVQARLNRRAGSGTQ